jgi:hypothetical protein
MAPASESGGAVSLVWSMGVSGVSVSERSGQSALLKLSLPPWGDGECGVDWVLSSSGGGVGRGGRLALLGLAGSWPCPAGAFFGVSRCVAPAGMLIDVRVGVGGAASSSMLPVLASWSAWLLVLPVWVVRGGCFRLSCVSYCCSVWCLCGRLRMRRRGRWTAEGGLWWWTWRRLPSMFQRPSLWWLPSYWAIYAVSVSFVLSFVVERWTYHFRLCRVYF